MLENDSNWARMVKPVFVCLKKKKKKQNFKILLLSLCQINVWGRKIVTAVENVEIIKVFWSASSCVRKDCCRFWVPWFSFFNILCSVPNYVLSMHFASYPRQTEPWSKLGQKLTNESHLTGAVCILTCLVLVISLPNPHILWSVNSHL
jgi:hypothetical protein